tara:strand:- start:225 stop:410 length:186 start_codon:yes stop_codon:yes gene_type:complete
LAFEIGGGKLAKDVISLPPLVSSGAAYGILIGCCFLSDLLPNLFFPPILPNLAVFFWSEPD